MIIRRLLRAGRNPWTLAGLGLILTSVALQHVAEDLVRLDELIRKTQSRLGGLAELPEAPAEP